MAPVIRLFSRLALATLRSKTSRNSEPKLTLSASSVCKVVTTPSLPRTRLVANVPDLPERPLGVFRLRTTTLANSNSNSDCLDIDG